MKNKLKEMKGITLIALVITIIVLLILAGVSIATLTGENGILTQATNAKQETKQAEADEMFKLIANEWQIEKRKTGARDLEIFLAEEAAEYGVRVEDGNVLVYNGEKVQIDNNGTLTEVTEEEEPVTLAAGIYDESGSLIYTWDNLTDTSYKSYAPCSECSDGQERTAILIVDENGVVTVAHNCIQEEYYASSYFKNHVVIPGNIKDINLKADSSMNTYSGLKHITILNGVMENLSSFKHCKNLVSITIPTSVKNIKNYAFYNTSLEFINYDGTKEQWNAINFYSDWNAGCSKIIIHCTNGDITIPENDNI